MGRVRHFLFGKSLANWVYNLTRYNRYGLMRDDLLRETPAVEEALKRLPEDVLDQRNFRIIRAMQLSANKTYLPKEQWTKLEDEVLYLQPYIDEVEKEWDEMAKWEKS